MKRYSRVVWRRRLDAAVTVLMVGVAALAVWSLVGQQPTLQLEGRRDAELPTGPIVVEDLLAIGRQDSTASVIVFSDFQCPYCATFAKDGMQELEKEVVETGLALFQFAHFPIESIHPLSRVSAQAVECARAERELGWKLHDTLFGLNISGKLRSRADVDGAITAVSGGSGQAIIDCVVAGRQDSTVSAQVALGGVLGVVGTPTFIVGRRDNSAFFPTNRIVGVPATGVIAAALKEVGQGR